MATMETLDPSDVVGYVGSGCGSRAIDLARRTPRREVETSPPSPRCPRRCPGAKASIGCNAGHQSLALLAGVLAAAIGVVKQHARPSRRQTAIISAFVQSLGLEMGFVDQPTIWRDMDRAPRPRGVTITPGATGVQAPQVDKVAIKLLLTFQLRL